MGAFLLFVTSATGLFTIQKPIIGIAFVLVQFLTADALIEDCPAEPEPKEKTEQWQ